MNLFIVLQFNTSGYFSDPIKTICSRKCAKPGISDGSLKLPTPTHKPHDACLKKIYIYLIYT